MINTAAIRQDAPVAVHEQFFRFTFLPTVPRRPETWNSRTCSDMWHCIAFGHPQAGQSLAVNHAGPALVILGSKKTGLADGINAVISMI